MMPGRRFTTGAAVAQGLTKSHSDPYRAEQGPCDRDVDCWGGEEAMRRHKKNAKREEEKAKDKKWIQEQI